LEFSTRYKDERGTGTQRYKDDRGTGTERLNGAIEVLE